MIKQISFAVIASTCFILVGVFLSEKHATTDWFVGLFLYLVGLQWVYAFLFSKTMYTFYTAIPIEVSNNKQKGLRVVLFIIGLVFCYMGSISGVV